MQGEVLKWLIKGSSLSPTLIPQREERGGGEVVDMESLIMNRRMRGREDVKTLRWIERRRERSFWGVHVSHQYQRHGWVHHHTECIE